MALVTVGIADDHPVYRNGLRHDLSNGFHVVAEAGTGRETVELVRRHRPQVLLCDLAMPDGGGIGVAAAVGSETAVVILTASDAERDLLDAIAAGAVGYLLKSSTPEQIRDAVFRAARGEPVFSPSLAALLVGEFRRLANAVGATPLSPREREVLVLVARGYSNPQVAGELTISVKTVESHVSNILAKLHMARREELARYAVDHGLL